MARRGKTGRASRGPGPSTEHRVPSTTHRVRRWRRAAIVAGAVVIAALVVAGGARIRESRYRSQLPPLPTFTHEPNALRERLEATDRAARAAPASAHTVGALGLAYHANMFYEQADHAYGLAEELGGDWRWAYFRALVHEARGDPAAVAGALRGVVARASQFSPAWWRLGEAEFKLGRRDAAAAAFERARTLPEPAAEPWPGAPPRKAAAPVAAYAASGIAISHRMPRSSLCGPAFLLPDQVSRSRVTAGS